MLKGARHNLLRRKSSVRKHIKNSKNFDLKDLAKNVSIEDTALMVERCVNQISLRGLHTVDIFRPTRVGEGGDETKYLLHCLLSGNQAEFEDEIQSQNIHNVVAAMKWILRHCPITIVPYHHYESFATQERESNYELNNNNKSCLFTKSFLKHLPKLSQEILVQLFEICAQVTIESKVNKMSANKIIKSLSLCLLGDRKNVFGNFDKAYAEWTKCSNACLHLFLAYLREKTLEGKLHPNLSILLENYIENRRKKPTSALKFIGSDNIIVYGGSIVNKNGNGKVTNKEASSSSLPPTTTALGRKSLVHFEKDSRPISILRVTRSVPPKKEDPHLSSINFAGSVGNDNNNSNANNNNNNNNDNDNNNNNGSSIINSINNDDRRSRVISIIFPDVIDNIKRRTIIRPSEMMTKDEQLTAEQMWEEFQSYGIAAISDEFLKIFFLLDEREISNLHNLNKSKNPRTPIEKNWFDFSRKGFKSFYLEPPSPKSPTPSNNDDKKSSISIPRPKTVAWEDFSEKGFSNPLNSMLETLTISPTLTNSNTSLFSDDDSSNNKNNVRSVKNEKTSHNGKQHNNRKISLPKFRVLKKKSLHGNSRSVSKIDELEKVVEEEEDWEDWYIIDPEEDFPVTTHLAIESIDEIFPYVWIEAIADETRDEDEGNRWGDWIFVEPRKGLVHDCEWIMIEEKEQDINAWKQTRNHRSRKAGTFSSFSIPWVNKGNNRLSIGNGGNVVNKATRSSSVPPPNTTSSALLSGVNKNDIIGVTFNNEVTVGGGGSGENRRLTYYEDDNGKRRKKRLSKKIISPPIPLDYTTSQWSKKVEDNNDSDYNNYNDNNDNDGEIYINYDNNGGNIDYNNDNNNTTYINNNDNNDYDDDYGENEEENNNNNDNYYYNYDRESAPNSDGADPESFGDDYYQTTNDGNNNNNNNNNNNDYYYQETSYEQGNSGDNYGMENYREGDQENLENNNNNNNNDDYYYQENDPENEYQDDFINNNNNSYDIDENEVGKYGKYLDNNNNNNNNSNNNGSNKNFGANIQNKYEFNYI